jgi:hypothetical protein
MTVLPEIQGKGIGKIIMKHMRIKIGARVVPGHL